MDTINREHVLNVSGLEPPEPLELALDALDTIRRGEFLRLLIHREPLMLYPLLEQEGFVHELRAGHTTPFEVLIWHRGDRDAEQAARAVTPPDAGL